MIKWTKDELWAMSQAARESYKTRREYENSTRGKKTRRLPEKERRYLELFGIERHIAIKKAKKKKPETQAEVRTFETTKNKYLEDGLCDNCAAQAAWGHQNGFKLSWSPCAICKSIVDNFPRSTSHPDWRCWPRGTRRPQIDMSNEPTSIVRSWTRYPRTPGLPGPRSTVGDIDHV